MKLSLNWLKDYVGDYKAASIKDYCDVMTYTGSKVEGYEILGEDIKNVVVGKIISVEPHPDADKLQVCMLDVGEEKPIQIVTGAKNVSAGDFVPVARHKSKLPGGVEITKGKLRGVLSEGMLCSISELNLTTHDMPYAAEDGILILQEENMKAGQDIKDLLMLSDSVVEFEITPNRPDCLSVIGLARETAASFNAPLKLKTPVVKGVADEDISKYLSVKVEAPDLCPRYTARVVRNVKIAPSPLWLRMLLRASGVRPINNIVDITNYVMLEYGQPMHAFDYNCLDGGNIIVRRAGEGESIVTLDSAKRELDNSMLVIADKSRAVALAGIMGGENSEIKDDNKTVVFESANFEAVSVRTTSRKTGLRTESSGRYEKGLYPQMTYEAVERACELVELLGAGEVVGGIIDVCADLSDKVTLDFEVERINKLLGTSLGKKEMAELIIPLGFEFDADYNAVTAPYHRLDVERTADIAEEVCRIYGYGKIDSGRMYGALKEGSYTAKQTYINSVHECLCAYGASEICTYSFVSPKSCDMICLPEDSPLRESIKIINPLGEDTSIMRTTAIPSMIEVLAKNYAYRNEEVTLYEVARVYNKAADSSEDYADEKLEVVIGSYTTAADSKGFFKLKGIVENLLAESGITDIKFTACTDNPIFHGGRCAAIASADGTAIGVMGELHPQVAENYDFGKKVYVYTACLDAEVLYALKSDEKKYRPIPKYPAIVRDIALICKEDVTSGDLLETIKTSAGKYLVSVELFDVYRSAIIGEGYKSMAYSLTLRDDEATLTVEQANEAITAVLDAVLGKHGAKLQ